MSFHQLSVLYQWRVRHHLDRMHLQLFTWIHMDLGYHQLFVSVVYYIKIELSRFDKITKSRRKLQATKYSLLLSSMSKLRFSSNYRLDLQKARTSLPIGRGGLVLFLSMVPLSVSTAECAPSLCTFTVVQDCRQLTQRFSGTLFQSTVCTF